MVGAKPDRPCPSGPSRTRATRYRRALSLPYLNADMSLSIFEE